MGATDKIDDQLLAQWFDFYVKEIEKKPRGGYQKFEEYFLCPCCHFPTLTERQVYQICMLCGWEDDGQDDHNAIKILGGPNRDYSLKEARENFKNYLTCFRPDDRYHFERTTVKKTFQGKIICDLVKLKREIIELYNLALKAKTDKDRKGAIKEAMKLEKKL